MRCDEIDVHIGRQVRNRRVALRLSQSKLAEKLGVSFQQVQKYESGTNRVSGSRLWNIAETLGIPVSELFAGLEATSASQAPRATSVEEAFLEVGGRSLAENYIKMSADHRSVVSDLASILSSKTDPH